MDFPKFITVQELEHQLNLISGQEQATALENLILAASDVINAYVKGDIRPKVAEGEPEPDIYPRIKQATKMLAAEWYLNRETNTQGVEGGEQEHGFLPKSIQSFLYDLRTPTVR